MATWGQIVRQSGMMKPEEYEAKAQDIETKRQATEAPFVERGRGRVARTQDIEKRVAGVEMPSAPDLEKMPEAPQQSFRDATQALGGMGMLLAFAGSLMTRAPLTSAMDAMASSIEGFHKGDEQQLQLARTNWKNNFERAQAQNRAELEKYNAAISKANGDLSKAQAEMHVIAAESRDDNMLAALESGNYERMSQMLKDRQNLGEKMATLQSSHDLRTLLYGGGEIDASSLAAQAGMIENGMSPNVAVPGGTLAAANQRKQAQALAINNIMRSQGVDAATAGRILANNELKWKAAGGAVAFLTRQEAANGPIIQQLDFNAEQAKRAMVELGDRDVSPVLNAIANGASAWTGDPAYTKLFYFMQGAMMEGAKLQAGAAASNAQLHAETVQTAKKWADQKMTLQQWDALVKAMKMEGEARIRSLRQASENALPPTGVPAPSSAGGWDMNGEKERRYQELKRRQSAAQ